MSGQGGVLNMELITPVAVAASLRALLERVVQRDQAALGELYDQVGGRLYALASAILRSREDAEEVVCDTFSQAWNEASRYDPARATVSGWLTMICRSRALDRLRQRRSRPKAVDLEAAAEVADPLPQPADLLSLLEQGTRVCAALANLPAERRELVALAFLEGLSHAEIAERRNLPIGTVKSHVRRALLQLRDDLQSKEQ